MRITFKFSCKKLFLIFALCYVFGVLFGCYVLYYEKTKLDENTTQGELNVLNENLDKKIGNSNYDEVREIEIWGKASIGDYLWEHIFGAPVSESNEFLMQTGILEINNLSFTYRTGPGLVPSTAPHYVSYLILILNGRTPEKIKEAQIWLNSLPAYDYLKGVIVMILGNERCDNDWLIPYMKSRGGMVSACFITYDCPLVDHVEFFQWPLGVATYRGFPDVKPDHLDISSSRPYLCNFLGTVYDNSSRQKMHKIIESSERLKEECIVITRDKWQPLETSASLQSYIDSLLKSDLTLSPVGVNTECYRIYEALSMGSVPVVEDVVTPGNCDSTSRLAPLRLLKSHGAPLIYIKNWSHLSGILQKDYRMTIHEKILRRLTVVQWYKKFKYSVAQSLINVINKKFFN